ncbi:hypothetical protein [Campylobacter pinnipediorum]|uniref:hypothetical protein n=1 Tax=Campylobacter pinnipediorum TaxID=1965231 RepID=UPI0009C3AF83|nr:hypothetical protein [Campylobacter pinnipediorum]AQW81396.1 hypothetical protein CPIN17260_1107 [Campylobacter pinnipediorum subsp. pinnipediorum]AQW83022.1 hypothetical protein CPIN17261_1018 [Campylobacter pinnipediorum subsp. pinnipediorum]
MIPKNYKCPKCGNEKIKQDRADKLAGATIEDSYLVCKECGYTDDEIKFMYYGNENIVKHTCRILGITQKELAEMIGVADNTPAQWATQKEPPEMAIKFMNLLLAHNKVKKQLDKFKQAFKLLDEAKQS